MTASRARATRTSGRPTAAAVRRLLEEHDFVPCDPGGPGPVLEQRPGPVLVRTANISPTTEAESVAALVQARWTPAALSRRPVVVDHLVVPGDLPQRLARGVRTRIPVRDIQVRSVHVVDVCLVVAVEWTGGPTADAVRCAVRRACPGLAPYLHLQAHRTLGGPTAVEAVLAWLARQPESLHTRMLPDDYRALEAHLAATTLPSPGTPTPRGQLLWAMAQQHSANVDQRWVVAATLRLVAAVGSVDDVLAVCDSALRPGPPEPRTDRQDLCTNG